MAEEKLTAIKLLNKEETVVRFKQILGKRAPGFITSVLSVISNNKHLKDADPGSVYNAAMIAASLDLPINQNLGFAYIVPYKNQAQFQMGYKGFIQLAIRSGQFKAIKTTTVYEGQLVDENPIEGNTYDWTVESDIVIGYLGYFRLLNGFEAEYYMTKDEVEKHAKKYSKSYEKSYSVWKSDFDAMAEKTVIKLLLSKYAPLSVDMQTAITVDQAVVKDVDTLEVDYVDGGSAIPVEESKEDYLAKVGKEYPDALKMKPDMTEAEAKVFYFEQLTDGNGN